MKIKSFFQKLTAKMNICPSKFAESEINKDKFDGVVIENFSKKYGNEMIFSNFSYSFQRDNITAVLGNSGTGKTTLLNAIAGEKDGTEGSIKSTKNLSYVFQNQNLLPNLNVYKNVEYVLHGKIKDKKDREKIIKKVLTAAELWEDRKKFPRELSAGMAQRVSMARAFAYPSSLLLMDEPFRGLDIGLKSRLISYFLKLWEGEKKTVIVVTHSIDEALLLADKIVVVGERPIKIIKEFNILEKKEGRDLSSEKFSEIYHSVYKLFQNS